MKERYRYIGTGVSTKYYKHVHYWLNKNFGSAHKCEHTECERKSAAFQWSKLKDSIYEKKRENFWMLCSSCHAKYDIKEDTCKKISIQNTGKLKGTKKSEETKLKMSIAAKGKIKSKEHRRKLADAQLARPFTKRKPLSDEHKAKISLARTALYKNKNLNAIVS